jgi:hypothetical protein
MLIQACVVRVVAITPEIDNQRWSESMDVALEMFREAGVEIVTIED